MPSLTRLTFVLLAVPAALTAQREPDTPWLAWLGCWQVGEFAEQGGSLVCLRPGLDPLGVEVATVTDGAVTASRSLIADGRSHDLTVDDCAGWEMAGFSADGRRVYRRSQVTCPTGRRRTASGIMALASPAVWLDVQSVEADTGRVVRALHYYPAPAERWPDAFRLSLERAGQVADARELASDRLSLLDVREAASQADPEAVATFLLERSQRFDLTAEGLAALADAEVPDVVIDAVVAVSYPERFALDRRLTYPAPAAPPVPTYVEPYDWHWWGYGSCLGSLYCDPYDYGWFDRGYGYRPRGYGGYWGQVVILDRTVAPRGTAVRGQGYTRGGQPAGTGDGRYAKPRGGSAGDGRSTFSTGSGGSTSSGSGGASPGGYSRGGGSSSGGSAGTAKHK